MPAADRMRLIMWDLDGTLPNGQGRRFAACVSAFTAFSGLPFAAGIAALPAGPGPAQVLPGVAEPQSRPSE